MTDYIIYHEIKPGTPCSDGLMAAAIALLKFPSSQLIGDSYKNDAEYGDVPFGLPEFEEGDRIIIVDFSYPSAWLNYWESKGVAITLIDHHAPKFPMLEGFSGAILDADECGATLAWKHFFPNRKQPEILKHVRRRDIGADGYYKSEDNCRDSKAITAAMSAIRFKNPSLKVQIELCITWLNWDKNIIKELETQGEAILQEEEAIAATVAAEAFESELCGYKCGKIFLAPDEDRLASQIGNLIARQHPEWNFAWLVSSDGKSNSLRSANGFDVSAIARQMGGNGHAAAAGFQALQS